MINGHDSPTALHALMSRPILRFGPNGEAAHGANEAVFVDDLVTQAQVYITTVRGLLA